MQTGIKFLVACLFIFGAFGAQAHGNCGGDEEWSCEMEVEDRSGTIDSSRCKDKSVGRIACYEEIKETCEEENSGRTSTREYTRFTGVCTDNYSNCW